MQYNCQERNNKDVLNSIQNGCNEIPSISLSQNLWAGNHHYYFSKDELNTIQQIYSKENRYLRRAVLSVEGIEAAIKVNELLGIKKEMNYVPASTISAIISQCSALALWCVLLTKVENPKVIYNQLVENELVGFKREESVYKKRIPAKTEITVAIKVIRIIWNNGDLIAKEKIILTPYMETEILGYAFLSKL